MPRWRDKLLRSQRRPVNTGTGTAQSATAMVTKVFIGIEVATMMRKTGIVDPMMIGATPENAVVKEKEEKT